jgi:DNA repair protein RecO (recombination protein O)
VKPAGAARASTALQAYVLHSYDWSETSLIVELFTRERGRVVVAAKGAKRPTSQLRPVLLPFQPLQVQLGRTPTDENNEVHTLRSAEYGGGVPSVAGAALLPAFYLNELLLKLVARQDPHPALFDAYVQALAALGSDPAEGPALRAFELLLLRGLGVLPALDAETTTLQPLRSDGLYTLHPEAGLLADREGQPGAVWLLLAAALAEGGFAAVHQAATPVAAALRGPLRQVLHYHLGASPLRTRQVALDLQRWAGAPSSAPASSSAPSP